MPQTKIARAIIVLIPDQAARERRATVFECTPLTIDATDVTATVNENTLFTQDEFGISTPDRPTTVTVQAKIKNLKLGKIIIPEMEPEKELRDGFHSAKSFTTDEIIRQPRRKSRRGII